MKKLAYLVVFILGTWCTLFGVQSNWPPTESEKLHNMFIRLSDGIVYCHSDRSKTTGVVVKKTSTGSWILTAGHKADRDFPKSSKIDVKADRERKTKMYTSLSNSIIVPEDRGLDLMLFFVKGFKAKYVFKKFRTPYLYEENWVFGFRGGAGKVPSSAGYVTEYFANRQFIFTSASVWRGCSGAPVISRKGEVLGIAIARANDASDGLFISGKVVKEFIDRALEKK